MRWIVALAAIALVNVTVARPSKESLPSLGDPAHTCKPELCKLPDCRCSTPDIPGDIDAAKVPQVVLITFDDAVNVVNYAQYEQLLFNRFNPNGCPAKATFFISHEYTDYTLVNDVFNRGHEIASHSITHRTNNNFWLNQTTEVWTSEIVAERTILESLAAIPEGNIVGMRAPFLINGGNEMYRTLHDNQFNYDCTWPTREYEDPGMWPYTLDFRSKQDCQIGRCPTESFPGTWVVPMVDLTDAHDNPCAMLDTCDSGDTADTVFKFLTDNFKEHYEGNRSPFGLFMHSAWLQLPGHFDGYEKFLNSMSSYDDVYFTTISELLEWVKNPTSTESALFACDDSRPSAQCNKVVCGYKAEKTPFTSERYMNICNRECPPYYPWYGNIDGSQPPTPWNPY